MRANNIVAIHNATLGGSTRNRTLKFTDYSLKSVAGSKFRYYFLRLWVSMKLFLFERFNGIFKYFFKSYTLEIKDE